MYHLGSLQEINDSYWNNLKVVHLPKTNNKDMGCIGLQGVVLRPGGMKGTVVHWSECRAETCDVCPHYPLVFFTASSNALLLI